MVCEEVIGFDRIIKRQLIPIQNQHHILTMMF